METSVYLLDIEGTIIFYLSNMILLDGYSGCQQRLGVEISVYLVDNERTHYIPFELYEHYWVVNHAE